MNPVCNHHRRGSSLLIVLTLIILLTGFLTSLFLYSRRQRTDAGKQARQQSATAAVENRFGSVISAGRQMLETRGVLSMDDWTKYTQESSSAEVTDGYLATIASATSNSGAVVRPPATAANAKLAADTTSLLSTKDDPFLGARAYTLPSVVSVESVRTSSVLQLGDEGLAQTAGKVQWEVTTGLRAIPMSQFSLFAGTSYTLDASRYPSGLGRTYVGGDAAFTGGNVASDYRLVVAGNAYVDNGTITAKSDPSHTTKTVLTASTTDPSWRNLIRPTDTEGGIITGAEMPAGVAIPATVAQMVASPTTDLGDRNIYRLSTQAARVVRLVSFDPVTGGQFVVTDASGAPVANSGPWRAMVDVRNAASGPAIIFAYAEQFGAGALAPSYYVMSDVPGTMLILRQTRILTAPLSVATPLPTAVINGLDDLAPGAQPNDPAIHTALPRFANSLISGAGRVSVWQE